MKFALTLHPRLRLDWDDGRGLLRSVYLDDEKIGEVTHVSRKPYGTGWVVEGVEMKAVPMRDAIEVLLATVKGEDFEL